jgi:hypothetical protein
MTMTTKTPRRRKIVRVKMITQDPTDRNTTTWLPESVAWLIGQTIAKQTHLSVLLYGEYGIARFNYDGTGTITWNERATEDFRGRQTTFDAETTDRI